MGKTLKAPSVRRTARGDTMSIVLKDVPPTYDWGWYSREDPRMHLQAVDKNHHDLRYKVWLERSGRRVVEPEPGIPAKVWKALQKKIVERRGMIEAYWIGFMMRNHWLELHVKGPEVSLVAYPGFPHRFVRKLNLHDYIGNPDTIAKITPSDVVFNEEFALLEIFPKREEGRRDHIRLEPLLWT